MPYWDEAPYKTVTHNRLGSDITSIMLHEYDVEKKINSGDDPVEISILKWEKILEVYDIITKKVNPYLYYPDIHEVIGYKTCALCLISIKNFEREFGRQKYKEDRCRVCPLSAIERCIDESSTYSAIERILNSHFVVNCDSVRIDWRKMNHEKLGKSITSFIGILKKIK